MLNVGLIGGTFDPFHNAHLDLVHSAWQTGTLDRLVVMPSGRPPHKMGQPVSMAGYRFEMARRGLQDFQPVEVSDLEIRRPGRSYTLDTVTALRESLPEDSNIILIYGSDILLDLEKWYHPEAILAACPLFLAIRGGYERKACQHIADRLRQKYAARISFFDMPPQTLSGSLIREMIQRGESCTDLLPASVYRFIQKNKFYQYDDGFSQLDPAFRTRLSDLECQLWPFLTSKRLIHSLNVMNYAIELARQHNIPLEAVAIAALLHDCAKCLPETKLMDYACQIGDRNLLQPELVHGPAGAWMAKNVFGIEDPAILRSIHFHTTGCADMSDLDKVIYLADKIEPGRNYTDLEPIRQAAAVNLDQAMLICLFEVEKYLERTDKLSHPYAQAAYKQARQIFGMGTN